jgi:hypothetical protein
VNRAAAVAADTRFAKKIVVPRLERWKGVLNGRLLPMFGDTVRDLEWDYDSPVPEDKEEQNEERNSKAEAAVKYAEAGYGLQQIADMLELPLEAVEEGLSPKQQADLLQKSYLASGVTMTREEIRVWLRDVGGFDIDPAAWDEPEKPPAPVVVPAPPGTEPSEDNDEDDESDEDSDEEDDE